MPFRIGNLMFGAADDGLLALVYDTRTNEVVAESSLNNETLRDWIRGNDKEARSDRERTARRRKKLVKITDDAIRAMGTAKAEPEEVRDLLLWMARLAQNSINIDRDDELLTEIEAQDK